MYKKIKTIEINRFQWLLTLLSKQIAQCMNLNRFDYCWWSTTQTPKLFPRGTNIRFVPTKSDWVSSPSTGGDGGDRRPLRVLLGLSTIALRWCPTAPFLAKKLVTGNFFNAKTLSGSITYTNKTKQWLPLW